MDGSAPLRCDCRWGDSRLPNETITISRWPQGTHYYLVSDRYRVFVPDKYDSFISAQAEARKYVPESRIVNKCAD